METKDQPELVPALSKEEIERMVSEVAAQISFDCKGEELFIVATLKGAFVFMADLARAISIPVYIDFIGSSSYGAETISSDSIKITKDIAFDLRGKNVMIVEDIVDTGLTLQTLLTRVRSLAPASVKTCAFIDKTERREHEVIIDYVCHTITEGFLVGYGLDYKEKYRELPAIYNLKL